MQLRASQCKIADVSSLQYGVEMRSVAFHSLAVQFSGLVSVPCEFWIQRTMQYDWLCLHICRNHGTLTVETESFG